MWPVALIHSIGTGTDPRFAWMLAIEAVCVGSVIAAVTWRMRRIEPTAWRQLPATIPQVKKWS
jgi:sulfoxide reductase heme-binding subunit YedZ